MKTKKIVAIVSLSVILFFGLYAVIEASTLERTYDDRATDPGALLHNPSIYGEVTEASGISDVIVRQNLEKTMAANNVAAVVFDFRGFDTLGESFILLTAIAGSFVILSRAKKSKKEDEK